MGGKIHLERGRMACWIGKIGQHLTLQLLLKEEVLSRERREVTSRRSDIREDFSGSRGKVNRVSTLMYNHNISNFNYTLSGTIIV